MRVFRKIKVVRRSSPVRVLVSPDKDQRTARTACQYASKNGMVAASSFHKKRALLQNIAQQCLTVFYKKPALLQNIAWQDYVLAKFSDCFEYKKDASKGKNKGEKEKKMKRHTKKNES